MRRVGYEWHLRQVMAGRGLYKTTDLAPLLAERGIELSPSQVHRLVTQTPARMSLDTLVALCDALECTIPDLIEQVAVPQRGSRRTASDPAPAPGPAPGRPPRARITGDE